jgi:hypothetical protein
MSYVENGINNFIYMNYLLILTVTDKVGSAMWPIISPAMHCYRATGFRTYLGIIGRAGIPLLYHNTTQLTYSIPDTINTETELIVQLVPRNVVDNVI